MNGQESAMAIFITCLRIWSRETGLAVPSHVSLLISILRLNLVLMGFLPISYLV